MPDLTVRDLVVQSKDGRRILEVDNLDIAEGETLGVRGPSGAGKSTLLHALAGLLRPSQGEIRWGDRNIAALSEGNRDAFRLKTMGLIFQDFLLFEELSALGNAAVSAAYATPGDRASLRQRAADLLVRLGLEAGARDVSTFSGGERQRVAVARALATDPAVILADEPTASLDRVNADRLVDDLLELARANKRSVIAVSHDPAVTGTMDRVIEVVDGRVRA
ncbi:MAG: ABC transporter ATP-binding protein [Geminicoccaceae bacterium]